MKITKIAATGEDEYMANVEVKCDMRSNIDPEGNQIWDVTPLSNVARIPFRINIEYLAWGQGIETLRPALSGQIEIPVTITKSLQNDQDVEEVKNLVVDLGRLEQQKIQGGVACALHDMTLVLDPSYQVDYENSKIEVLGI